jgi:hypothetical protein
VDSYADINVSEKKLRQDVSPKHWYLPKSPDGVTAQKTSVENRHIQLSAFAKQVMFKYRQRPSGSLFSHLTAEIMYQS